MNTDTQCEHNVVAKYCFRCKRPDLAGPVPDIIEEKLEELRKALNLRDETISGVDEIGMVKNAFTTIYQRGREDDREIMEHNRRQSDKLRNRIVNSKLDELQSKVEADDPAIQYLRVLFNPQS